MNPSEAHARATIAAALIIGRLNEVPSLPPTGDRLPDPGGLRLRELTRSAAPPPADALEADQEDPNAWR